MSENKIAVDRIVDDIVDNFKEITGYDIADVFNKNSDEPVFNQDVIDKSIDSIKNYVSYNYDVDIIANEDILYALDAKLAEMHNRAIDAAESEKEEFKTYYISYKDSEGKFKDKYVDLPIRATSKEEAEEKFLKDHPNIKSYDYKVISQESLKESNKETLTDNEDPDFIVNESTWAETEVEFGPIAQKKLEAILDADLFDDLEVEIDDNKLTSNIVNGIFTDRYRVAKKEYSDYSEDEIRAARKELFRIINKFYKMATDETESEPKSNAEESYFPPKDMGKMAIEISDYLGEFMNKSDYLDDNYFDEYDREAMGQTFDALVDYAKTKSMDGLSESATEDTGSNADGNQDADKHYIIYDTLDDENKDNDRLYSKSEAIGFLKELLKIEKESISKSQIEFLTRHREDEGLNFDLDHLSDAELEAWFDEFNYKFYDQNKVEDSDEYVD